MTSKAGAPTIRMPIDLLLGRTVVASNGQSVGRIQEFRVDVRGSDWVVTDVVLGVGGLLERLNVGLKLIVGGKVGGKVARVDQIDITDPTHPRLTCAPEDLRDA
jgi:hypothetical protein